MGEKTNIGKKKGLLLGRKSPLWGVKKQNTAYFSVNSYSLSKYLSFDMLESIDKKKNILVKKGLLWGTGVKKRKNLKFSVKSYSLSKYLSFDMLGCIDKKEKFIG